MIGSSPAYRRQEDGDGIDRPSFLASHRAQAACTRELSRLGDEIEREVLALHAAVGGEAPQKPVIEHSPGRLIVQLGPVALTVAWLRGTLDSVGQGELLVIVWRGSVAPRRTRRPERANDAPLIAGATPLWEDVLVAAAESEAEWTWRPQRGTAPSCSSVELAARCVERLRVAHAEC